MRELCPPISWPWGAFIRELRKFIRAEDLLDAIYAGLLPKRRAASVDGPALYWSDFEKVWPDLASRLYVAQRYPTLIIDIQYRSLDELLTISPPLQSAAAVEKRLADL